MNEFQNSRRLVWFNNIVVAGLCFAALFHLGEASVPILTPAIPSMLGLVGYWSKVVNK